MSAAVALDPAVGYAGAPAPRPTRRPQRPRLVLVPTGDAVPAAARPALRLTRAGRLAITTTVLLAAAVAAFLGLTGGAAASSAPVTVTVQPGQTLSQIAAEHLAGQSVASAVAELQLANDLRTAQVQVGQTLVIPQD
ncbi:LysM domain-containing protein [Knoellia remsis]|uniref:LysM domain-containing protein n=1 Tax=Knoellia remsis TaxID=407159 RepID=A0A2T0TZ55_9MICO|nr:LysM peptidoglycan-binding domain-containing protein [Knoellia remsis]PRY50930.1 LysM domain-containing protein [Knoellia remsis]